MYKYEDEKSELFTDDGQRMFLRIRDFVHETIEVAGAVSMGKAMSAARGRQFLGHDGLRGSDGGVRRD